MFSFRGNLFLTKMLFAAFLGSYLIASSVTFLIDISYPELRKPNPKEKNIPDLTGNTLVHYSQLMKIGVVNILSSVPVFWNYEYLTQNQKNSNPLLYNMIGWLLITDLLFYIIHRIFHLPSFYQYHSLHHSYTYTYGPSALYCSVEEFFLSNLLPNLISFQMLSLSHSEILILIVTQTFYTVIVSHGGYKIFVNGHQKHHLTRQEPYGLFMTDRIVVNSRYILEL